MGSELKNIIEAVLMVSDTPLSVSKIQGLFDEHARPEAEEIKQAITDLTQDCQDRAIELVKVGPGYRFQTRIKYAEWIRKMQTGRPPRLSRAQLETLAIIAYRQPVTRGDIEEIRGVTVSPEIMQRLSEREWIKSVGVRDTPGRPELFGTTAQFLSYFSIGNLSDLPPLMEQREPGEIARDLDMNLPPEVLSALEGGEQGDDSQSDVFDVSLQEGQRRFAENDGDLTTSQQDAAARAEPDSDNDSTAESGEHREQPEEDILQSDVET